MRGAGPAAPTRAVTVEAAGAGWALWYSPPTLLLLAVAGINLAWLVAFLVKLPTDRQYVFPAGMENVVTSHLPSALARYTDLLMILFNVALAFAPLTLLLSPAFRRWAAPLGLEVAAWIRDRRRLLWTVVGIAVAVAILVPLSDHTRLPFTQERVRWATDWFPLPVPIIPAT